MTSFVVVTGTGTGVGKTVATAALAASAAAVGARVAVAKPVQTGLTPHEPGGDAAAAGRLAAAFQVHELVRLPDPLAPESAARLRGIQIPAVTQLADQLGRRTKACDVVVVEGAGGVRVRLDTCGGTLLELAGRLRAYGSVEVAVVVDPGLGTLNVTELTVDAVRAAGLEISGLVVGSWPPAPGLAERCNLTDLPRLTGLPVLARLPAGCGSWPPDAFVAAAPGWFVGADELRRRASLPELG
ncbi:MAG: dethiobiotin synthase [Nocardioidaceae bacterium]